MTAAGARRLRTAGAVLTGWRCRLGRRRPPPSAAPRPGGVPPSPAAGPGRRPASGCRRAECDAWTPAFKRCLCSVKIEADRQASPSSRCLGGIADGPGDAVTAIHLLDRSHVLIIDVEAEDVGVRPNALGVRALRK